jgi:hypothetical protein
MPIGLSIPAKLYSANRLSLVWHRISPMVGASAGCFSLSLMTLQ